jgi:hypothetical protein
MGAKILREWCNFCKRLERSLGRFFAVVLPSSLQGLFWP